jgi:hypothetical protein
MRDSDIVVRIDVRCSFLLIIGADNLIFGVVDRANCWTVRSVLSLQTYK